MRSRSPGARAPDGCGTSQSGCIRPTPSSIRDDARGSGTSGGSPLGIARAQTTAMPIEPVDVGEVGEPAVVEVSRASGASIPLRSAPAVEGRTALLSPFDRLVYDGSRARAVRLRLHTWRCTSRPPSAATATNALSILHDDRLVGKVRPDTQTAKLSRVASGTRSMKRTCSSPAPWQGVQARTRRPGHVARAGYRRAGTTPERRLTGSR